VRGNEVNSISKRETGSHLRFDFGVRVECI